MMAVRWILRHALSYRDLEELLAERVVIVDHVALFPWGKCLVNWRLPYTDPTLPAPGFASWITRTASSNIWPIGRGGGSRVGILNEAWSRGHRTDPWRTIATPVAIAVVASILGAACAPKEPSPSPGPWDVGGVRISVNYAAVVGGDIRLDARSVERAVALGSSSTEPADHDEPTLADVLDGGDLLADLPLATAFRHLAAIGYGQTSLLELDVSRLAGWTDVAAGALVQTMTVASVLETDNGAALDRLTVADVSLKNSPMRRVPVLPILFDSTPLSQFPLADGDAFGSWCSFLDTLNDPAVTCAALSLTPQTTVGEATIRGVPMRRVPMRRVPMRRVPWQNTALATQSIRGIRTDSLLGTALLRDVQVNLQMKDLRELGYPGTDGPILDIPLSALGKGPAGVPNPFDSILAGDVGSLPCNPGCAEQSIVTLTSEQLGSTTLDSLYYFFRSSTTSFTVADLAASLGWTGRAYPVGYPMPAPTFGDVIANLSPRSDIEEILGPNLLSVAEVLSVTDLGKLGDRLSIGELLGADAAPASLNDLDRDALATTDELRVSITPPAGMSGTALVPATTAVWHSRNLAGEFVEHLPGDSVVVEGPTLITMPRPVADADFKITMLGADGRVLAERSVAVGDDARSEPEVESLTEAAGPPVIRPWRDAIFASGRSEWFLTRPHQGGVGPNSPFQPGEELLGYNDSFTSYSALPLGEANIALSVPCPQDWRSTAPTSGSVGIDVSSRTAGDVAAPPGCNVRWEDAHGAGETETISQTRSQSGTASPLAGDVTINYDNAAPNVDVLVRAFGANPGPFGGDPHGNCIDRQSNTSTMQPFPKLTSLPAKTRRVLVTDSYRMGGSFAGSELNRRLTKFARKHRGTVILDVSTALYASDPFVTKPRGCGVAAPYAPSTTYPTAERIRDYLQQLVAASDKKLEEVNLIGSWDIVPPAFVGDPTTLGSEQEFGVDIASRSEFHSEGKWFIPTTGLETEAANAGLIPTDDVYGALDLGDGRGIVNSSDWLSPIYLPTVNVSRLVDSPASIIGQLDQFDTSKGRIVGKAASAAAYDFLEDSGVAVAAAMSGQGRTVDASLVGGTWNATSFLSSWFPSTGAIPSIKYVGAHFNETEMLTASGNVGGPGPVVSIENVAAWADQAFANQVRAAARSGGLAGSLIFTVGCHSGSNAVLTQDWPEVFGEARVGAYVGVSAYGYGDTEVVAYSERLAQIFAQQLGRTPTVGEALRRAKSMYVAERGRLSGYDYKVLASMTLYGFAGYQLRLPNGAAPTRLPAQSPTEGLTAGSTVATTATNEGAGVTSSTFSAAPVFDKVTTGPRGTFFSTAGGVATGLSALGGIAANDGQPVLPAGSLAASRAGVSARGVVIESVEVATTDSAFDGWFVGATLADAPAGSEPVRAGAFPPRLAQMADSPGGERVSIVPARYSSDGSTTGELQRFSKLSGRVYFGPSSITDREPPQVGNGEFDDAGDYQLTAHDPSGVLRVVVLYRAPGAAWTSAEAVSTGADRWGVNLVGSSSSSRASGYVQVVDRAGNVSTLPF